MFPLAFVAGWLQGHWWGFISRNYVVWPTFFLMNVWMFSLLLKDLISDFIFTLKKKKKKNLALCSAVIKKHTSPQSAWRTSNSSMHQNSKHINQDPTTMSWNKMSIQQQDPYWNAGATDIQQLNPNRPDQRQSIEPQPIVLNILVRSLHYVWGTTHRRAIKEGSC